MKNIFNHIINQKMKVSELFSNMKTGLIVAFVFLLMFILGMYALNLGKNIKISSSIFNIETSDKESIKE